MIEILITIVLVILSGYIIYRNIKKSSKGECNCSDCDTHCSKYEDKIKIKK
ncbi:FeoB-associated Cys-rich membrane protein [Clostridium sp. UBA1652]|uniref:FeoB-associated Cys-rich membrane protein n=1 Tax=Clostridium sp. UBA1652 TaxID=1946348 RepID=UPI0032E42113